jgi:hypothetical protein
VPSDLVTQHPKAFGAVSLHLIVYRFSSERGFIFGLKPPARTGAALILYYLFSIVTKDLNKAKTD